MREPLVVDWDGTVTEVDGLHLVLSEFGDVDVYEQAEERLGRSLTLHEVIAFEFETVRAPLADVVAWVRSNVRIRPGFADLARRHRPLVVSSGFHELIDPVLERVTDVVEVVVELIRNASLVQVLGEAVARKNASRRLRDAAIREPVSHVDEVTETRNVGPLAWLAADRTGPGVAKDGAPTIGARVEPVGAHLELQALALQHRIDELMEATRDHEWTVTSREVGKAGSDTDVRSDPGNDIGEWRTDGLELECDHLVKRQAAPEALFRLLVHVDVTELGQNEVQAVHLGHGPVPIDDERLAHRHLLPAARARAVGH